MKKVKDIGEKGVIEFISSKSTVENTLLKVGIGDDCAVFSISCDFDMLVTTDMLVEGTHFLLPQFDPKGIGSKAILSNISDIAANGGIPIFATISIGLNPELPLETFERIVEGITEFAKKYKVSIIGGDTVRSEKIVISISLIGTSPKDKFALRSRAKPREYLIVTGDIGASAIGLEAIIEGYDKDLFANFIKRHYEPDIKVEFANLLVKENLVSSMIDISDGLVKDAGRIAESSCVAIIFEKDFIPVPELRKEVRAILKREPIEYSLFGGEDYELLFTAKKGKESEIIELAEKLNIKISKIGFTETGKGLYIEEGNKRVPIEFMGFEHF
jgi:thiamine-monophosphate kinase